MYIYICVYIYIHMYIYTYIYMCVCVTARGRPPLRAPGERLAFDPRVRSTAMGLVRAKRGVKLSPDLPPGTDGASGEAQAAGVLRFHRGVAATGIGRWSPHHCRHPGTQRNGVRDASRSTGSHLARPADRQAANNVGGTQVSQQGATSPTLRTDRRPTSGGEERGAGRTGGRQR